jgi:hypothetical protein
MSSSTSSSSSFGFSSALAAALPPPPLPGAGPAAAAAFIASSYLKSYFAAIPTAAKFLKAFMTRCGTAGLIT